jgi:transposase
MLNSHVLGIDVAKDTLAIALLPFEKPASVKKEIPKKLNVPNSKEGFIKLQNWLCEHNVTQLHVCLEATSTYGDAVAHYLYGCNYMVSVINPLLTRRHSDSEGLRGKTDPMDAASIARYCREKEPRSWCPATPEQRKLISLTRHIEHLKKLRKMESTTLQAPGLDELEIESFKIIISSIDTQIISINKAIRTHVAAHPVLAERTKLLLSIPGIGEITAWIIVAELGDRVNICTPRQLAAFAGLTPQPWQSGSSVNGKPRLSKKGNIRIRSALFYPAMTAIRCNPIVRSFSQRLSDNGKSKMAVLGAAMHKLLKIAVAILKSGKPFDPNIMVGQTLQCEVM